MVLLQTGRFPPGSWSNLTVSEAQKPSEAACSAGGFGSLAVQLAAQAGARVIAPALPDDACSGQRTRSSRSTRPSSQNRLHEGGGYGVAPHGPIAGPTAAGCCSGTGSPPDLQNRQ